jgi:glucuronate isomerase
MFTSAPSLIQAIERLIDQTPIIDPHAHIRCDQPGAPDLAALLDVPWVRTELRAVGMPAEDLDPAPSPEEHVRRALPYLKRMRNTAASWCLHRIFRGLYDFSDPDLTEANARDLFDKVAAAGRDPARAWSVLRERCNVRAVVTGLGQRSADPGREPDDVSFRLDAHALFCPGVATESAPGVVGRARKADYYEALRDLFGEPPASTHQLQRLLGDWLDRTLTGRVRFTSTFVPIEQRFRPPDETRVNTVLARCADDWPLDDGDADLLAQFISWRILAWHHERRKAVQLAVGAGPLLDDGTSIPRFQEAWTAEMARTFHHFAGARFDLLIASDLLAPEAAVLAGLLPNVYTSGYWRHALTPATIERIVGLRLPGAPMTKVGGFLSDAAFVEWIYARLQLVKKAMAASLARLVEAGFYEEDELPSLLRQILHDTPRDLYDLT